MFVACPSGCHAATARIKHWNSLVLAGLSDVDPDTIARGLGAIPVGHPCGGKRDAGGQGAFHGIGAKA